MEAMKHHQGSLKRFISMSFFLKKATKFLVSVSIFSSIIFSYSFCPYVMQVFAHNIDKSYMFLLCNGILVFVVKNSAGLIHESQQGRNNNLPEVAKLSEEERQSIIVTKEVDQEAEEPEKWSSSVMVCAEEHKEEEEEEEENEVEIIAAEEYDQEDGVGLLTIEELNKKCDDFIRKMKEEIKFGAQQLIMV